MIALLDQAIILGFDFETFRHLRKWLEERRPGHELRSGEAILKAIEAWGEGWQEKNVGWGEWEKMGE